MDSIGLPFTANPSVKWSGELHNHQKYWKLIVVKITVFLSHGLSNLHTPTKRRNFMSLLTLIGSKSGIIVVNNDNTRILVFEMQIGMNEF